jgi:hypothetical protein
MYKQMKNLEGQVLTSMILRVEDNACIPFDPANNDYAQFKKDILEGAELLGADGQAMNATQFAKELP